MKARHEFESNIGYDQYLITYFAAKYMQGIASNESALRQIKNIAYKKDKKLVEILTENSYGVAQAMLKERTKHL